MISAIRWKYLFAVHNQNSVSSGKFALLDGNLISSNNVVQVTRSGWIDGETSLRDIGKEVDVPNI